MQPDYMKMAQAQKAPQEQPQEAQEVDMRKEFEEAGLPTGDSPEDAKVRVMAILEEIGVTKNLKPDQLQKLSKLVDDFVKIAMSGDMKALEKHPISQLLNQAASEVKQAAGMGKEAPTQPQQPQQPAAPTNFAGMVKPPGGGMSGR